MSRAGPLPVTLSRAPARRARALRSRAFDALVFDLDGVLYDGACGYLEHVRARQRMFLRERFFMDEISARRTRDEAFARASQAYKGLMDMGYMEGTTQEEFTAFCRAGVEAFLRPSAELEATLRAMRGTRRVVFTNTSEIEGERALRCLGLDTDANDVFVRVYGGLFTAPACKPERAAFEKVFADLGGDVSPERCVMFEDSMKNLKTAKSLGMRTVFVRTRGETPPSEEDVTRYCDAVVDSLTDISLREQMPELFA